MKHKAPCPPSSKMKPLALFLAATLSLGSTVAEAANLTTGVVRGAVVSDAGQTLSDVDVVIEHVPSATVKRTRVSADGNFFGSGLRPGGPYRITVRAPGFEPVVIEDYFVTTGSQRALSLVLSEKAAITEELVVRAKALRGMDLNNGLGSAYTSEDVANQPATKRDVIRTLLRDPLAQSDGEANLSVAGVNPRFNGFAIDGALQQDDFGLGSNTYATDRSPINIDAIESVSLRAADYSVVVSGFTGGLVNVTTKSGTNEFDGSVFYYYQDPDYIGDTYAGDREFNPGEFEEEEYGFTVGGPILKDKLFFFVSYDEYESFSSNDFAAFDRANGIQPGFFDALATQTEALYGYNPGTRPAVANTPITSERTLGKLDWNINDQHRASLTYQNTEELRTSVSASQFDSAWYDVPVTVEAYTGQLFSNWTDQLSTTLRVNYKENVKGQDCRAGAGVGHIDYQNFDQADLVGGPLEGLLTDDGLNLVGGCDRFRHFNAFEDERLQIFASADYLLGDHLITAGAEYEEYDLFNAFVASSRGRFRFFSYDQFLSGDARIEYVNATSNNANDAAAAWGFEKTSLFLQDTWQVRDDLELNLGLRYETFSQSDAPAFSQDLRDSYGLSSAANIDGLDLFQPRIGFRWTGLDRTEVTGGFGLFAGGDPKVWISNAFQPLTVFARTNATVSNLGTVPQVLLDDVAAGTGVPIDVISEDFEVPSDWKASLRVDHTFDAKIGDFDLGDDYTVTAQVLYTQVRDGFLWTNLAQTQLAETQPLGVAPDGRNIYADLDDLNIANVTQLGNYDDGESTVMTLGLSKRFDNGFEFQVSYAYQDVEAVTEGTSSRGISNWRGIVAVDRNNPQPRVSPFEVEHAFKVSLGYEREFFRGLRTRLDVFGQILRQDPYTLTYDINNTNHLFGRAGLGEGPYDNNPLYVPNGRNDAAVVYGENFDVNGFFAYLDRKGIPAGVQAVNAQSSVWNNIWDLRLQQDLPSIPGLERYVGENRIKLQLDIENFLNLLNDEWGTFSNGPSFGQANIVQADLISAADLAANGVNGATALTGDAVRTTCVSQAACVYRYNDFDADPTGFDSAGNSVYRIRLGIRMEF